jgi:hypothetical protein
MGTREDPVVERKIGCGHMHTYPVVGRSSYITSRGYGMRNGKLIDAVNSGNASLMIVTICARTNQ